LFFKKSKPASSFFENDGFVANWRIFNSWILLIRSNKKFAGDELEKRVLKEFWDEMKKW
jgi:hypothetical protein